MTATQAVQRSAERLIRASCRRLPEDERADRCREWSAELPAILADTNIRLPILRAMRTLRYSAGISRTTRQLSRPGGRGARRRRTSRWRDGAIPVHAATPAFRLVIGVIVWLICLFTFISLVRAFPQSPVLTVVVTLGLAVVFDAFCLVDIVRASQVRYLPKWAWALICLAQAPLGGIVYLSVGRVSRARPVPPGSAQQP